MRTGFLVEATGFEPAALCSQSRCATKLRYASKFLVMLFFCSLGLLCSPSCGAQIFLRLGAPEKSDRCASFCSLLLPPAVLAKLTQSRCATKLRYASRCFFHAKRVYLILKLLSTDFSCGSFLNCFTQKFTFLIDFIFIGVYNEICKLIER